jgi:hypothetical protein
MNEMIKFIKKIFKKEKIQQIEPVVTRRFPFGESLNFNNKTYRYLYSYGENDVLMRDDEEPSIIFIPSKYIIED